MSFNLPTSTLAFGSQPAFFVSDEQLPTPLVTPPVAHPLSPVNLAPSSPLTSPIVIPSSPLTSPIVISDSPVTPLHLRSRKNREGCVECSLKNERINCLSDSLKKLRETVKTARNEKRSALKSVNLSRVNQRLSRKEEQTKRHQLKYAQLKHDKYKDNKKIKRLENQLSNIKSTNRIKDSKIVLLEKRNKHLAESLTSAEVELKTLAKENREMKMHIDDIMCRNEEVSTTTSVYDPKKNKKEFSCDFRLLAFHFFVRNCPVKAISPLVVACAETFGVEIASRLPTESTLELMDLELGVLGQIHVSKYEYCFVFLFSSVFTYIILNI